MPRATPTTVTSAIGGTGIRASMRPPVGEHVFRQCAADGTWLHFEEQTACLLVLYTDSPLDGMPYMQLQLGALIDVGRAEPGVIMGTREVLCNLTPEQSLRVLQEGVPKALMEDMLRIGKRNGWLAELVPLDQKQGWPQIMIQPDRYFKTAPPKPPDTAGGPIK